MKGLSGVLLAGCGLALAVAAAGLAIGGGSAATAGLVGGVAAVAAQAAAVALLRPAMGARTPEFLRRWALGMAVRGVSAAVVVVLAVVLRGTLPALWLAAGYLVVLLPLLFTETRFLR